MASYRSYLEQELANQILKDTSNQILKKLEEWQGKEAVSSSFLDFYKGLLGIQI